MPGYSDSHNEYYKWRGLTRRQRLDETLAHLEGAAADGYITDEEADVLSQRVMKIILSRKWDE